MNASPPRPTSRRVAVALVILQLLQLGSLLPWLMIAGFAVMAFDAPGSSERWQPWAFVLTIWSYPLWLIAAGITAWILQATSHPRIALAIAVVFTLPALIVGGLAVSMMAA